MLPVVIDASVVCKWLLPEPGSADAHQLLTLMHKGALQARAPELVLAEVANVLWKRTRGTSPSLSRADAKEALAILQDSPLELHSIHDLAAPALELAALIPCTVYDALYVTLALRDNGLLVSADQRLLTACAQHGLGDYAATVTEALACLSA